MGGWWDDFSNNLATDLGPLISLFGEAPTKQYLSETISFEEIIVFATAPLGILTTIVSVIRVCGSPSLRAFIGRAQEGEGNAEVELCSSTSKNVGELYNNGGIARIFGRPSLLEIVHDPKAAHDDFYFPPYRAEAGIHSPRDYFNRQRRKQDAHEINPQSEEPEWVEIIDRKRSITRRDKRSKRRGTDDDVEKGQVVSEKDPAREKAKEVEWDVESDANPSLDDFAPSPNLSLNVGIKQRPRYWFVTAAILGVILQAAVVVWAAFARYGLGLSQNEVTNRYAVPMTTLGTIFVCFGVGFCAYLIERSTQERHFERKTTDIRQHRSKVYWIQPGGQKLGDQIFDSFAYTHDKLSSYVTSWKANGDHDHEQNRKKRKLLHDQILVWAAVLITFVGFSLQFLGLRACHSSVSVCQLGVMLVMSFVRAVLRTERLAKEDNLMRGHSDVYQEHELDWLAFQMVDGGCGGLEFHAASSGYDVPDTKYQDTEMMCVRAGEEYKVVLFGLFKSSTSTPEAVLDRSAEWLQYAESNYGRNHPHEAATLFRYRSRLAHLTKLWPEEQVAVRGIAKVLAKAIEETASLCLNNWYSEEDKTDLLTINWPLECLLSQESNNGSKIFLSIRRHKDYEEKDAAPAWELAKWKVDVSDLEAVLGLLMWSHMKKRSSRNTHHKPGMVHRELLVSRILYESAECDDIPISFERESGKPIYFKWTEVSPNSVRPGILRLGWQNVPKQSIENNDQVGVVEYMTRKSIAKAFAQEIYASFVTAIAHLIYDHEIDDDGTVREKLGFVYVDAKTLSNIKSVFEESGLGTRNDAVACFFPAMKIQDDLQTSGPLDFSPPTDWLEKPAAQDKTV
ncbi:hypothetical protein HDK90DRAFT_478056 [Phyllosticta capitalensis]|uniref:Uncharacterized protein n=1 Tax=Phyllosticta capitalensis TaxID=121624 RepID=A0ABR1Z1I2_9PEZI